MNAPLDARQRAMLAEMGIPLWAPPRARRTPPVAPPASPPQRVRVAQPPAAAAPATVPLPVPVSTPAAASERLPDGIPGMDWVELEAAVAACRACGLCQGRTQTVFGVGDRQADWMVVGEAPGREEDRLGEPFVGQAGKLLDNMLAAIGLSRRAGAQSGVAGGGRPLRGVYIANVVKCRPPNNRNPEPEEIAACEPYLKRQIALVQPRIILAMGRIAVHSLLKTDAPIGRLRGRLHAYEGVPVVVTYHPAYLLRALPEKAKAWQDLCLALAVATDPPTSGADGA